MQASGVQVLEWRHLKNALMEHTVTQVMLDIVFCVQKVIGEVLGSCTHLPQISTDHSSIHSFIISFADIIAWCLRDSCLIWSYILANCLITGPQTSSFLSSCLFMWYISFIAIYRLDVTHSCCRYKLIVQLLTHELIQS